MVTFEDIVDLLRSVTAAVSDTIGELRDDISKHIVGIYTRLDKLESSSAKSAEDLEAVTASVAMQSEDLRSEMSHKLTSREIVEIKSVTSGAGSLTIALTNGVETLIELPAPVVGEKGEPGERGLNGVDGKDGRDGVDGAPGERGERGERGADGRDGVDGQNGKDGDDGRDGENGEKGADGVDGKDGERGADGRDGKDGVNGKDGAGIASVKSLGGSMAIVADNGEEFIVELPKPAEPVNVKDMIIDRSGELNFTLSSGETKNVGRVVGADGKDGKDGIDGKDGVDGKDGKDGRDGVDGVKGEPGERGADGFGFDDMSVYSDDGGRTIVFKFAKGGEVKEFPIQTTLMQFKKGYKSETTYQPGDVVSFNGSSFHAAMEVKGIVPGSDPNAWQIMATAGRDGQRGPRGIEGKDGRNGKDFVPR